MCSAVSQPKAGRHFTKVTNDRSSPEFADYLLDPPYTQVEPPQEKWPTPVDTRPENQSSHTRTAVVQRFWRRGRRLAVESVHRALHPEARQLVKPGGDRDQPVLPAMLGPTPDWRSSFSAEGNTGVEPPHESRPGHDPVELHSQAGSQEVWLQHHAVTVLVHDDGECLARAPLIAVVTNGG